MRLPTCTHRVISHAASRYGGCGYFVRGESVYCESREQANNLAWRICGGPTGDAVKVKTEDGIYWYASQEDADADDTGASADAVVCALTDEEQDFLVELFGGRERCEAGAWHGEPCDGEPTVRVVYVPEQWRGTARAAGTWHGLTERLNVCDACAEQMREHDGDWMRVRPAQ